MAKLILSLEGSVIREIALDKERITIGRKPHNDVQIENLAVSGEHARIVTLLNDSFLEDLGSTNGTLVNGNPVTKHILQDSDVIEIGKYKLKFMAEARAATVVEAASMEDFERTMILHAPAGEKAAAKAFGGPSGPRTNAVAVATAPTAVAPPPPMTTQPAAAIQILNGPSAGREMVFTKNLTTLGKAGVQVAVIARRPQGYFITHVEGVRFPVVNGKTLDAQAHPLTEHDVIELAGVKMEFFFKLQ